MFKYTVSPHQWAEKLHWINKGWGWWRVHCHARSSSAIQLGVRDKKTTCLSVNETDGVRVHRSPVTLSPCHHSRCLTCVTSPRRASPETPIFKSQHEIYRHSHQSVTSLVTVKVFFFLHHPHYNQHLFSFQLLKCYISRLAAKTIISRGINDEAASVCQTLRKKERKKK